MKKTLAIVGLLACAPVWAANGLSYNYVQANWIFDTELDGPGSTDDGDGFDIGGVFSFTEMFYVLGEYKDLELDNNSETQEISLGVGAHSNMYTGAIDVFGNLSYEDIEIEVPTGTADDDGFGIEIGARTAFANNFDAYISYKYTDYSDVEGNFFKIGGAWGFNPNWAVIAEFQTGEYEVDVIGDIDRDDIRAGIRYNF